MYKQTNNSPIIADTDDTNVFKEGKFQIVFFNFCFNQFSSRQKEFLKKLEKSVVYFFKKPSTAGAFGY